ncbi:MAG TPA: ABC transporter substrate-binding protein [Ktedonobacteraceae bacterium]
MLKDQFDLFADHQEAIRLFQKLCERQSGKPWALLPVLSLIGPAGYGKSAFIDHLYFHYCDAPFLPHISLDFGRRNAPHDLLNILGALRQSLRRQRNAKRQALAFPRFDIVYSRLKRSEGLEEEEIDDVEELFGEFGDLIGLAGNIHVALGFLLFLLKFVLRLPILHAFLRWLVEKAYERAGGQPQWHWYQDQVSKFKEFNVSQADGVSKIRSRLNEMCTMGEPERQFLINQILPKAFLADLRYGNSDKEASMLKDGPPYVVIFLDSFEVLLRNAEPVARQLLEILALNEYRKRGDSDPLLLIVASEEGLPEMSRQQLNCHFPPDRGADERNILERANALYEGWAQQLPPPGNRYALSLKTIYLPLPLPTLTQNAVRHYLLRLDQGNETDIFANEALIEDMYRLTQGYPIFLERVATVLQASMQHPSSGIHNLEDLFASEQGEQIVDRLLALHCKQVEERAFMLSAIPQTLTPDLLRLVLKRLHLVTPDATTLSAEWRRYRHLPFLLASEDDQHIAFVPGIRALFLKKLQIMGADPDSDYLYMHQLLADFFTERIETSLRQNGTREKQDVIEQSYHQLALDNYEPVIEVATLAQQQEPALWEDLLKVIARSPATRLPSGQVKREASRALYQAQQQGRTLKSMPETIRAIVLYTWLLANPGSERKGVSSLWYELGVAYQHLQEVDPKARPDTASACHRRADELLDLPVLQVRTLALTTSTRPLSPRRPGARQLMLSTYRFVRASRRVQISLGIILIGAVLLSLYIPHISSHTSTTPAITNPFVLPLNLLQPAADNQWIGTTIEADGEFVGLSDGTVPFDYLRPDGALKIQAAGQLYQGNLHLRRKDVTGARLLFEEARATFQRALQNDVNDAEALISAQNIQVFLTDKACGAIFVVATRIIEDSSEGVNNGRDNMQGAYLVQKEYNDAHPTTPICLYIANLGNNPGYELSVAQQVVKASQASKGAIKGLIGWPGLLDTPTSLGAVQLLQQMHLPIVSPDSYDDTNIVSNVFHVSPSRQDQGGRAAVYAEHVLQAKRALIIADPTDPYSHSLTESFKQRFEENGNQVVALQTYTTGQTSALALAADLQNGINSQPEPDLIYFTGGVEEGSVLLAQLRTDNSSLPLLGSEQLYPFLGFSTNAQPGFTHLAFTSAAYADALVTLHMRELYALNFDPSDPDGVREYGYRRPDSTAILSYDAMEALITAYTNAAGLQSLQQALSSLHIEGASRQLLAFTPLHELADQSVFIIHTDQQGHVRFPIV